jgi:nitroreductase
MKTLIRKTRTVRRFREQQEIDRQTLVALVDLARLGGSARNLQPLKYKIVQEPEQRERVFPHLGWAGYIKDWPGPAAGERPVAYIICLLDTALAPAPNSEVGIALGIASQNILLGAADQGIFGCRIGAFSPGLQAELDLTGDLQIMLVIALGYPAEQVVLEDVGKDGEIRYWRDKQQVHHVPKRSLQEILL